MLQTFFDCFSLNVLYIFHICTADEIPLQMLLFSCVKVYLNTENACYFDVKSGLLLAFQSPLFKLVIKRLKFLLQKQILSQSNQFLSSDYDKMLAVKSLKLIQQLEFTTENDTASSSVKLQDTFKALLYWY